MIYHTFRLIEPIQDGDFTQARDCCNAIFLAGPCPRADFSDDWRFEAFEILDRINFNGTVITPSNKDYAAYSTSKAADAADTHRMQTEWERTMMHMASAIVFWIPRDGDHPGLTTNIEFGEWYKKRRVYAGWPETAEHVKYLELKLNEQGKTPYSSLESMLSQAVSDLSNGQETQYFTADTHFGQQRTFEFSRRPFADIAEMDLAMASNWNKAVTMNDVVYHAGDFIDPEKAPDLPILLSNLNFKELHWTLGNYDRKIISELAPIVDSYVKESGRMVKLYSPGECSVAGPSHSFTIVHEPADPVSAPAENVILYGHIHGRAFAKRNGFDLAADYHGYTPISMEQVEWFANAMQYWDENVYTDRVNVVNSMPH